jgi:alkylation response protein AidB-like acyl-CoA dehydrogenase
MDFRDTPEEASFRARLRAWIEANLPDGWHDRSPAAGRTDESIQKEWTGKLFEAGYAGLTWPQEYGGRGLPHTYQAILLEETARLEAPEHIGIIGLGMAGPTIIAHGPDAQKERYLKPILSGEEVWCQGFSEPGSGSDLASLRTRATDDGDAFVVNGQKVWSSFAHIADFCILLVRTDPDAPKHRGITYLLVDMHADGVEVRPLVQITGDPEFNEIFFNDVRVPKENVLGEVGDGWRVAMTTLLHERGTLGFALTARLEVATRKLISLAR